MITQKDLDDQLRANLLSMQDGDAYQVSQAALDDINTVRLEYGYPKIVSFFVMRQGNTLSWKWAIKDSWNQLSKFDISQKNLIRALTLRLVECVAFTLAFSLSFAQLEKVQSSCAGKIVEIDGRKYKLEPV